MRSGAWFAAFVFLAAAAPAEVDRSRCDAYRQEGVRLREPPPRKKRDPEPRPIDHLLKPPGLFNPTGQILCTVSGPPSNSRFEQIEVGDIGDLSYEIEYRTSRFSVRDVGAVLWTGDCSIDEMDDLITCRLKNGRLGTLSLTALTGQIWRVTVGSDHRPASTIAIRIEDQKPIRGPAPDFLGPQAEAVIEELKADPRVRIRFYSRLEVNQEFQVAGLAPAIELMEWVRAALAAGAGG